MSRGGSRTSTTPPVIVAGTTDVGMRYVQVWDLEHQVFASMPPAPMAMATMQSGTSQMLGISSECPPSWVDLALRLFADFRAGKETRPTHTLTWEFGRPILTVVEPPAEPDALDLYGEVKR